MTIKMLKDVIKNLPDDMRIYADDGERMFVGNSEFLTAPRNKEKNMLVLQTRDDFDVAEELNAWLQYAEKHNVDEQDFWMEFYEHGYAPEDFGTPDKIAWAKEQMKNYGLI